MFNYAPQTTRLMKKIFTIAGRLFNLFLELFFNEYGFYMANMKNMAVMILGGISKF